MSECTTCTDKGKSDKQLKLEQNRANMEKEGRIAAKDSGQSGFWMALSLNKTGWQYSLERRPESKLQWEYISLL